MFEQINEGTMRYVHTMLRTNCTNVCRVTWEYTPSDSRTPERSTTHSCESSRAPKNSAIKSKNRSLKAMAHQTEFSCRPCLSHLRQEPQITQEFQRLLPLPLSNRVDQKENGTRKRITWALASALRSPLSNQKEVNLTHVAAAGGAPERSPHSPEPLLARSSKRKPVAPHVASNEVCTFR